MTWTIQQIEQYLNELAASIGLEFNTPVKINNRLTKTLGRVIAEPALFDSYKPEKIEFSKQFLETATDDSIRQVIEHEFCHWAVLVETGQIHHHDSIFKTMCCKINCDANKSIIQVEHTVAKEQLYKYIVRCKNCGNELYYSRAGKVVKYFDWYGCGKCGGDLELIQNW